jgi:hypothetical protein
MFGSVIIPKNKDLFLAHLASNTDKVHMPGLGQAARMTPHIVCKSVSVRMTSVRNSERQGPVTWPS